ncbi:MAG: pyridoxine 5'-phosphate synthase [Pseudomonadota bacterium]
MILLGVNVDHVATIRQARGTTYPDAIEAARAAVRGGADQITIHLREDRRHIQDRDLERMLAEIEKPLNLEMAAAEEIVDIACRMRPATATLVPERRHELTTEDGLDVLSGINALRPVVARLLDAGIAVSMFIDPEREQIEASMELGARAVELHTGAFCDASGDERAARELERLKIASRFGAKSGIKLCAGHGINYSNAARIAGALPDVVEYNIGHSIIARSIFVGMEKAVAEMKELLEAK